MKFRSLFRSELALSVATGMAVLALTGGVGANPTAHEPAVLDKPVTEFKLKDVTRDLKDGEKEDAALVSLAGYKGKKAVVLFFMSERCGTTWKYEKRIGKMLKDIEKKDVVFLGVRSSMNDTPESIRKYADQRNFDMPVLDDPKSELAKYFKARVTPTFVVIDKRSTFRYIGSFDDNAADDKVTKTFVADAIAAVLEDKPIEVKQTRPFG